jgi:hypothetical protein
MSTLLTLLIVPAAFSLADGLEKRLGPAMRRWFLTYDPVHSHGTLRDDADFSKKEQASSTQSQSPQPASFPAE